MQNLSQQKRQRMLDFLEQIKSSSDDEKTVIAINEIENELVEKKYGLVWEKHIEQVDEDIKIVFTGLRPGEKLYEEMLMKEEGLKETENKLIHIGKPIDIDEDVFFRQLKRLKEATVNEEVDVRQIVQEIVPTYIPMQNGD